MKNILVFSHMMKTAGTALTKQLIQYYGKKAHIVHGGLLLKDDYYDNKNLLNDFDKKNNSLKVLTGHPIRPYIDFNIPEHELKWFTFVRDPQKRYLSHYFHKYNESKAFSYAIYKGMKDKSITEWEKIDHCSNYQTKFISGEANAQKAIDIIEEKFCWVGVTEEYEKSVKSFKAYFKLDDLFVEQKVTNRSLSDNDEKNRVKNEYSDFIQEMNTEDQILYDYIKEKMWPKFKDLKPDENIKSKYNSIQRSLNMLSFQIDRQRKFKPTQINTKNLIRFYKRWYRK